MKEKRFAEHFCQLTDEVIVPLFKNLGNMEMFPRCLVNDIKQQVKHLCPIKVISTREVFSLRLSPQSFFSGAGAVDNRLPDPRPHQGENSSAVTSECDAHRGGGETGIFSLALLCSWSKVVSGTRMDNP